MADGNEKGTAGAVTTAAAAVGSADIIAPRLHSADPCTRCGRLFEVRRNTSTSCQMHMDSDGKLGTYLRYRVVSAPRIKYINKWSCCGQQDELAPGCSKRAHLCKEVMVSVRAEANPTVIVDNLEVTVFNALEISVFPGAQYEICVEITRQLVDILHTYFSIKEDDEIYAGKIEKVDEANVQQSSVDEGSGKKSAYQQSSALYIKYLRVGEINVEVSTVGFPVNLKRYNAIVAPFIKHGRILDWPRLIWMIEKHAIWSVTKHTATSGISQVWKSIFTSSAALPVRLGAVLETGPSEGVQSVNENNFWGDDNDEGARRGSEFLGIRQNKAALH